jgi:hypothetical protein
VRFKSVRTLFIALCAPILLGLIVGALGCSMPWASTSDTTVDPTAVVDQAVYRLQTALGLPDGAISTSAKPPILPGSDVALSWTGGRADVALAGGQIRAVLADTPAKASLIALSDAKLNAEADRLVGLLGWGSAALKTQGFTPGHSTMVDRADTGKVYQKTWLGHDMEGVLNEGVIEVGVDAASGDLRSFLFHPGPTTALGVSKTITKDAAVRTAREAAARTSVGGSTTTPASEGAGAESATLVHTDKTAITHGTDLLVWIVKLAPDTASGKAGATVYIDAASGEVLGVMTT